MTQRWTSRSSASFFSATARLAWSWPASARSSSASRISWARAAVSKSSRRIASSASMVKPAGVTSAKPPRTKIFCVSPVSVFTSTRPGFSVLMNGAWRASTVKNPSLPGTTTESTSSDMSSRSGETRSKCMGSATAIAPASRCFGEPARLLDRLLDRPDHIEGGLRQMVVVAVHQAGKALDGVRDVDQHARRARKDLGDEEGLRQKPLDLARPGDGELVLFGELVHAEDGDDILQRFVALQRRLHGTGDVVMVLADDARVEHAR